MLPRSSTILSGPPQRAATGGCPKMRLQEPPYTVPRRLFSSFMLHCTRQEMWVIFVLIMITPFIACAGNPDVEKKQTGSHPILGFYERFISPVDGDRCPMHPTCSAYTREAVQRHGLFMGWIMACDRLVRCGRDETRISPDIIKNKERTTLDPVSANDFWWYKEP